VSVAKQSSGCKGLNENLDRVHAEKSRRAIEISGRGGSPFDTLHIPLDSLHHRLHMLCPKQPRETKREGESDGDCVCTPHTSRLRKKTEMRRCLTQAPPAIKHTDRHVALPDLRMTSAVTSALTAEEAKEDLHLFDSEVSNSRRHTQTAPPCSKCIR
jgi:hypothetical protein